MRRRGLALATATVAALLLPGAAAAHAVSGIDYRFPLPVWLYALAAGLAVLLSAPAATLAGRATGTRTSGDLYGPLRHFRLGWIGVALASLLLVDVVVGGLFGPEDFFENPATIVLWVDFWVGLGIVSALVVNVWDFVSPLNAAGRFLERTLARRGASVAPYPARLGLWPATVFLLVWSWLELVWDPAKEPRTLVLILLAYIAIQLLAMVTFGTELWLARGELFTVVARTFARFAPLELYVREPAGECRARQAHQRRLGGRHIAFQRDLLDEAARRGISLQKRGHCRDRYRLARPDASPSCRRRAGRYLHSCATRSSACERPLSA